MNKIYSMLTGGVSFEKIMEGFDTNKVLHFADVQIGKKDFDFLLLDKSVFGGNSAAHVFISNEDNTVYSNLTAEKTLMGIMYAYLLNNAEVLQHDQKDERDQSVTALFDAKEAIDYIRTKQRRMSLEKLPNEDIVYMSDKELVTSFPKLSFNAYIADDKSLKKQFSIVFEKHHIDFFKRMNNLKGSFVQHKVASVGMESVEELRKEGIYINPIQYTSLVDSLEEGDHMLLTGPTGAGKSHMLFHIIRKMGIVHDVIECNEAKRYDELFGGQTIDDDGKLRVSLGKIAIAYRDGHRLILEEFSALSQKNFKALLTLMAHDELNLEIDNKNESGEYVKSITIKRHPDFQIIATANEEKRYGVNQLTPQVKRRFATILPINYLPEKEEMELIQWNLDKKQRHLAEDDLKRIVTIGNQLRAKNMVVSTATLIHWALKSAKYGVATAAICHFAPQVVFNQKDVQMVNDIFSVHYNDVKFEIAV